MRLSRSLGIADSFSAAIHLPRTFLTTTSGMTKLASDFANEAPGRGFKLITSARIERTPASSVCRMRFNFAKSRAARSARCSVTTVSASARKGVGLGQRLQLQRETFGGVARADPRRLEALQEAKRDGQLVGIDLELFRKHLGHFLERDVEIAVFVQRIDQRADQRAVAQRQIEHGELGKEVIARASSEPPAAGRSRRRRRPTKPRRPNPSRRRNSPRNRCGPPFPGARAPRRRLPCRPPGRRRAPASPRSTRRRRSRAAMPWAGALPRPRPSRAADSPAASAPPRHSTRPWTAAAAGSIAAAEG